jgi:5-methylthioadenosine/S-adenosylhomocysteine deaminase
MPADRLIISGGLIVAAGSDSARRADIILDGETIIDIVEPGTADGPRFDASERLVIPGLINAHTHGHGALAKGAGDLWSLELLLNAGPWTSGQRTDEDRYLSTLLSAIEMIKKGCTACYDLTAMLPVPSVDGLNQVARAYTDLGMRAVISPMIADRTFYQAIPDLLDAFPEDLRPLAADMKMASSDSILAPIREAAKNWAFSRDRIRLGIAPTIPLHCSDDFMVSCRDMAAEFGLPLQTHLAESPVQRASALKRYGVPLTAHLQRLGLLGPSFSGAHAIWIDESEIELIARSGGTLAHNPGSNLRLGNGIADVRRAISAGVPVGVGTDGSSSSDNQNMFEAMRLAAYVSRAFDRSPEHWVSTIEAFHLATQGSAKVLGMADLIGKIAVGYKADFAFLDLHHVNLVPLNNAMNQLVNTEDGSAVRDVMIGGRFVLQDRELVGIDWPHIVGRAQEAVARLARANASTRERAERLAPVVNQFCVGLGRCACDLPRLLRADAVSA